MTEFHLYFAKHKYKINITTFSILDFNHRLLNFVSLQNHVSKDGPSFCDPQIRNSSLY